MATSSSVSQLYKTVVEDVISNVKEAFLDEGVDEQVLTELRQLWDTKLTSSKALDAQTADQDMLPKIFVPHQQPQVMVTGTTAVPQAIPVPIQIAAGTGQDMLKRISIRPQGAAATATMALPQGLFQHQLAALNTAGNTILHTGNGQYIQVLSQHLQQAPQATTITTIPHQTIIQSGQMQGQVPGMTNIQNVQITPGQQIRAQNPNGQGMVQLDGAGDTSSSDDDEYNDDDDNDDNDDENNEEEEQGEEEEPLNSEDDVSEQDPDELFDTDNVVVCQYDKINRNKNKWKFHLKDGIMNLNGRDFVFQKATGDAEW
ncbi:transcription initiation factor IIA subunit 1-like isoform X1 [Haliotis asinina]|uniref:transcription initiation factor IIA subunit 1-like isoform X1 n=1 Tax=Haliotis asinina TaxID=109174 RepID=UPI0035327685